MVTDDDKTEVLAALDAALRRFAILGGAEATDLLGFMRADGRILFFALGVASSTPRDQFKGEITRALESHVTRLRAPSGTQAPNPDRIFQDCARMHLNILNEACAAQGEIGKRRAWFARTWTRGEISVRQVNRWWKAPGMPASLSESLWSGIADPLKGTAIEITRARPESELEESHQSYEAAQSEEALFKPKPVSMATRNLNSHARDSRRRNLVLSAAAGIVAISVGAIVFANGGNSKHQAAASDGTAHTGTATPSDAGSPQSGAAGSQPIAATVTFVPNAAACDGWIFPGKLPSDLPAPVSLSGATGNWAHDLGGVDERFSRILVNVEGLSTTAVTLLSLRVIDLKVDKQLSGTKVELGQGCGGVLPERYYEVYLSDSSPQLQLMSGDPAQGKAVAVPTPFSYKVSNTDPESFNIQADAAASQGGQFSPCNCEVSWRLALDWSLQGRKGTLTIDNNGQPFQTDWSSDPNSTAVLYSNGAWVH